MESRHKPEIKLLTRLQFLVGLLLNHLLSCTLLEQGGRGTRGANSSLYGMPVALGSTFNGAG